MNEQDIFSILHPEVQFLPLIEGCSLSTAIQQEVFMDPHFRIYPNPTYSYASLEWVSNGQPWSAVMFDKWGHQVTAWSGGKPGVKKTSQSIQIPSVPSGHYFINLRQGNQSMTKTVVIH